MTAITQAIMSNGGIRVNFDSAPYTAVNTSAPANLNVNRDGTVTGDGMASADWAHPKFSTVGDNYTINFHQLTGPALVGAARDTDLALTSNRTWTTNGVSTYTGTLTMKQGGNIVATANVTLQQNP